MTSDCWLLFVVILPLVGRCTFVHSFVPKAPFLQHEQTNGRCHELQQQFPHFGIAEWRDLPYEGPLLDLLKTTAATKQQQQQLPKVVSILPFPFNQVLLQGETKELRLYEDRFLQLFDSVMEQQGGIVGMGLLAQSGLIQTIPLCEIEAFQRMEGFGIFVTIRVVGRAQLVAITQQEPYLMGVCLELADEFPQDSTTLQLLTNTMEQTIVTITAMEYRLKKIMEATLLLRDEIDNNNNSDDTDDDDMVRRINIAKLVSIHHHSFHLCDCRKKSSHVCLTHSISTYISCKRIVLYCILIFYRRTNSTKIKVSIMAMTWRILMTTTMMKLRNRIDVVGFNKPMRLPWKLIRRDIFIPLNRHPNWKISLPRNSQPYHGLPFVLISSPTAQMLCFEYKPWMKPILLND